MNEIIINTNYFSGMGHASGFGILGFFLVIAAVILLIFGLGMFFAEDRKVLGVVLGVLTVLSGVGGYLGITTANEFTTAEENKVLTQLDKHGMSKIRLDNNQIYGTMNNQLVRCVPMEIGTDTVQIMCDNN